MDHTDINDLLSLNRLLRDLYHAVRNENCQDTRPAERIMATMIRNIGSALSQPDDTGEIFDVLKSQYSSMFPPKGGLTEFIVWREDPAERCRLNSEYEKTRAQISGILNRH